MFVAKVIETSCWLGYKPIYRCVPTFKCKYNMIWHGKLLNHHVPLSCGPLSLSDCVKSHDPSALLYGDWFTLFFQTIGSPLHPNLRDAPTKHLISEHTTNPHPQSRYAFKSILRHFLTPSLSVFLTVCLCHLPLRTYLFNMTSSGACDSTQMSSIIAAHTSLRWIHIVYIIKCILPLMLWTGVPCYISAWALRTHQGVYYISASQLMLKNAFSVFSAGALPNSRSLSIIYWLHKFTFCGSFSRSSTCLPVYCALQEGRRSPLAISLYAKDFLSEPS